MTAEKKITLYVSHQCPWCRRVLAVAKEIGIDYEEVLIDLSKPRPEWYLAINPKGQVPTLIYDGQTMVDSTVIAQFFADLYPSHLVKPSSAEGGALQRAEYTLFVNQFLDAVQKPVMGALFTCEEVTADKAEAIVDGIAKHIEPKLASAGPFFGGSKTFTLVEALTGPFIPMALELPPVFGFPETWVSLIETKAPIFKKWADATSSHQSITSLWNKEAAVALVTAKRAANKASK